MEGNLLILCRKEGEDKFLKCPLCGSDVYISELKNIYACSKKGCDLYNGSDNLDLYKMMIL